MPAHGASTFTKGLQILAVFESRQRSYTMAELARLTGFDRAATRRLCLSLVESGYLYKTDQHLSLTPKILAVAGGYLTANDIGLSVQPLMDQFATELNGEILLAVMEGDRAVYVACARSRSARVSLGFTVGSALPLLHTAIGRMLLGSIDEAAAEDCLQRIAPQRYTASTELCIDQIRAGIEQGRAQSYVYVANEFETGAAAIAVPVGALGGSAAVLGVTDSVNKLAVGEEQDRVLDVLRRTALALRGLSIFAS